MTACRSCGTELRHTFCDLGRSPLANAYLDASQLNAPEPFYPLRAFVCDQCFLVQVEQFETPAQIFSDYAYFSSYSDTWLRHAKDYVEMMIPRFAIGTSSRVVEIASNDGYLLQYFKQRGVPVLGIEPAANVARVAEEKGIPTRVEYFGAASAARLAKEGYANLIVANNVLAHVPELNDFVEGMRVLLAPTGVITVEVPHLLRLVLECQFDTIYHEHFSYFSFLALQRVFAAHQLRIFDVDEIPTHGGSLRLYLSHVRGPMAMQTAKVEKVLSDERRAGLDGLAPYLAFQKRALEAKHALRTFMERAKREGKRTVAYGAAAKGNTLLNFCGLGTDFIACVADKSPHKQGRYLPGTHLPIEHPDRIRDIRPDYLLVLPWNISDEIMSQNAFVRDWGGRFVIPANGVKVL